MAGLKTVNSGVSHKEEAQGLQSPTGHLGVGGGHRLTALQCQPHLRPQQPSYLTQQVLCHLS